jgi:uncharacterized protein (TIGR03086 family)
MNNTSERYRKNAEGMTARVEAVPAGKWDAPSPCESWTARDVLRHCVDGSNMFLGFVGRQLPTGPSVDDDPVGAWTNARDAIQRALDDPTIAHAEFDGFFGRTTFEEGISRFIAPDVLVHTWDIARATGLDERLDPDEVRTVRENMAQFDEAMMRQPGVFGPAVEPPAGADEQTKMLAFLGRRSF